MLEAIGILVGWFVFSYSVGVRLTFSLKPVRTTFWISLNYATGIHR